MKLLGIKQVKVGNNTWPIKITNRAMIEYEQLSHSSIVFMDTTERIIQFFYCTAKAGAKSEGVEFKYTFDQFLDEIDDYYQDVLTNFTAALNEDKEEKPAGKKKPKK